MGFYRDRIFPHIMNKACSVGPTTAETRERVCGDLTGDVVEIGFGSGLNVPHYPTTVTRVRAVEPLQKAVELASARITTSRVPIEISGLDGQRLPFDDDSADAVLCTWTLCSIPDPVVALSEVKRVLRPGGTFHFVEHGLAPHDNVRRWQHRVNPVQKVLGAGCNLNRDIGALVAGSGLQIERLDTYYSQGEPKVVGWTYEGVASAV